jgi:PAS domain S-box-containing protein
MTEADWFDATFARGPTGALLLDREGRVERANGAFRELIGAPEELGGKYLNELLASSGAQLDRARQRAIEEARKIELSAVPFEPARRDRRHTVDIELYPQSDAASRVTGVLMVVHDRTGAHSDIADSARLFYQAFMHSTNAMELTDRDGYLVDVNPAFERIYGYRKDEVLGRRPNIVASGKTDRGTYARMWADLLEPTIGAWSGEVINRDRRGIDHPVLLAITAIRGSDGAITHYLGVAVDLTERRAWERGAMHSERLYSLGQLAAGVAHEINTPLANIMLIAESIRRRNPDPWTQSRIDSLLAQSESAAKIVRGLLDFARRPETKVGEVELGAVVTNATQFLKGKQSADVEVDLDAPTEPVVVHGDREQITQVVVNLLNNSYDALNGHGRVAVRVRTDGGWAHIRVEDNGAGIPPEVLAHLFEPFFTTKPEGKGTGLGLAICHGIVQSHGGTIEVDSTIGRGTVFDVKLPLSLGESPAVRAGIPLRDPDG